MFRNVAVNIIDMFHLVRTTLYMHFLCVVFVVAGCKADASVKMLKLLNHVSLCTLMHSVFNFYAQSQCHLQVMPYPGTPPNI